MHFIFQYLGKIKTTSKGDNITVELLDSTPHNSSDSNFYQPLFQSPASFHQPSSCQTFCSSKPKTENVFSRSNTNSANACLDSDSESNEFCGKPYVFQAHKQEKSQESLVKSSDKILSDELKKKKIREEINSCLKNSNSVFKNKVSLSLLEKINDEFNNELEELKSDFLYKASEIYKIITANENKLINDVLIHVKESNISLIKEKKTKLEELNSESLKTYENVSLMDIKSEITTAKDLIYEEIEDSIKSHRSKTGFLQGITYQKPGMLNSTIDDQKKCFLKSINRNYDEFSIEMQKIFSLLKSKKFEKISLIVEKSDKDLCKRIGDLKKEYFNNKKELEHKFRNKMNKISNINVRSSIKEVPNVSEKKIEELLSRMRIQEH